MVSDEPTEGRCNAGAGADNEGYCEAWPVTDDDGKPINGRCRMHGGKDSGAPEKNQNAVGNEGGSAPKDNTNRVEHGLFAEVNKFYQNVMEDAHRELCDQIYEDYVEDYVDINGEPATGHEARLFEISVNHIKIIYSDNWAYDRPSELESGSPMVDKETTYKTTAESVVQQDEYKPSIITSTQQQLRREDRAWLREYGLLNDPESQKADSMRSIADILSEN